MIGIAVVGAGNWGKNLARNFANMEGADLKYVCDLTESVRKSMSAIYPQAKMIDDFQQVLSDDSVDGVMICPESGYRYKEVEPGVMRCMDLDEETPLPKELSAGEKTYDEFKNS